MHKLTNLNKVFEPRREAATISAMCVPVALQCVCITFFSLSVALIYVSSSQVAALAFITLCWRVRGPISNLVSSLSSWDENSPSFFFFFPQLHFLERLRDGTILKSMSQMALVPFLTMFPSENDPLVFVHWPNVDAASLAGS